MPRPLNSRSGSAPVNTSFPPQNLLCQLPNSMPASYSPRHDRAFRRPAVLCRRRAGGDPRRPVQGRPRRLDGLHRRAADGAGHAAGAGGRDPAADPGADGHRVAVELARHLRQVDPEGHDARRDGRHRHRLADGNAGHGEAIRFIVGAVAIVFRRALALPAIPRAARSSTRRPIRPRRRSGAPSPASPASSPMPAGRPTRSTRCRSGSTQRCSPAPASSSLPSPMP